MTRATKKPTAPAKAAMPQPAAEFSQQHPARPPAESDAHTADAAAGREAMATAGAGADTPATDKRGAGDAAIAAEGAAPLGSGTAPLVPPSPQTLDLVVKVAGVPAELRAGASLVVTTRQPQRRRAGRTFGRHETVLPLAKLTDAEISAIEGDAVLRTVVRVTPPPG